MRREWSYYYIQRMTGRNVCGVRKSDGKARRYPHHHQIARRHTFGDQRLHIRPAQQPVHVPCMALAHLRIAEHGRLAQQFFQRNTPISQQRMPRRNSLHQRVATGGNSADAIAHFVGLCKPHVVQVVMQALDLLRLRHLEDPGLDFSFFLPA